MSFFYLLFWFLLLYRTVILEELVYFIFFESILITTLFLILGWGYQPEWVQAGICLLLYTLLASLPLLVGILFIYNTSGSLCLFLLCGNSSLVGGLFYVCMVFAFLVRMPMFIVHLWLPKASITNLMYNPFILY
jgi:NADH-ubiquinone oxidoreductase chain 4